MHLSQFFCGWNRIVGHEYFTIVFVDCLEYHLYLSNVYFFFFFFQAEDGIRDSSVTGVQTCALPISVRGYNSEGKVISTQTAGISTRRLVGSIHVGLRRLAQKRKERREVKKRKSS